MNIAVVSYSHTGNNERLAVNVAKGLSASHIKITVDKPVTGGSIALDMLLGRTPKSQPSPESLKNFDFVLYVGAVWMGQVASPLRRYLHAQRTQPRAYGYLSISGGADGNNPKLSAELERWTGCIPSILMDLHIRDLLPMVPQPTRKDTSAYRITDVVAQQLAKVAIQTVKQTLGMD